MLNIKSLDISLSDSCNANCFYCPTPRIKKGDPKQLTLQAVENILAQISAVDFKKDFGKLETIEVGGLTEPLLNKEFLLILRALRKYNSRRLILYTNALLLNRRIIRAILKEGLITDLVVTLNNLRAKDYLRVNGINSITVKKNLIDFIALRKKIITPTKPRLTINALDCDQYKKGVVAGLKRKPLALPDNLIEEDVNKIMAFWKEKVSPKDTVRLALSHFQLRGEYALGKKEKIRKKGNCPWPFYVVHSMNITATGNWIICCNDFGQENILGNIFKEPIKKIADSPKRIHFIKSLLINDLKNLPRRCRLNQYCQFIKHE